MRIMRINCDISRHQNYDGESISKFSLFSQIVSKFDSAIVVEVLKSNCKIFLAFIKHGSVFTTQPGGSGLSFERFGGINVNTDFR